jgi:FlaA1/EpsC-like NDP-sugar epimerase
MLVTRRYRRLFLFALDIMVVVGVYLALAVMAWLEGSRVSGTPLVAAHNLGLLSLCVGLMNFAFGMYDSLWRYAEAREYLLLSVSMSMSFVLYVLASSLLPIFRISRLFALSVTALGLLAMLSIRFVYRQYRQRVIKTNSENVVRLAIVGAGSAGVTLLEEILRKPDSNYLPVCFFDDDPLKHQCNVRGLRVMGRIDAIPLVCRTMDVQEIIIAVPTATDEQRRRIIEHSSKTSCSVKILPDAVALIENEYVNLLAAARSVTPEDLLGRSPVSFHDDEVSRLLYEKTVLITGAGGSIGSELCRQIASFSPAVIVMCDIYENGMYDAANQLALEHGKKLPKIWLEVASVRDERRMDELFGRYRPQVVFHAAAHKHVPMMEQAPGEAIKNNVFGTKVLIDTACRYDTEKFVMLSTDKAVNPTNVMGATKRLCEMMVQGVENSCKCTFAAVRFGNVLGSNGSVIPLFASQIARGGPVTITHREITRFFMTIPEAAQLVLQAGALAKQSEIFVLDMGEPVKILSLAENLIRLSGLRPYDDVDIVEIGLRPGEKLYEELLMGGDGLIPTRRKKIFIENLPVPGESVIRQNLEMLRQAVESRDAKEIIGALEKAVPTYRRAKPGSVQTA